MDSLPRSPGIYKIVCIPTGRFYVGSSVNIFKRWQNHRCQLRGKSHPNPHLQCAWDKFGETNFAVEVLELCERGVLAEREQFYLDTLHPFGEDFNINYDVLAPMRGRIQTPEWRAKNSAGNKGRKHTPETIARMSAARKGEKRSEEARLKMSKAHIGKTLSPETRAKMSAAHKGKIKTPEHLKNLSLAMKGKKPSLVSITHSVASNEKQYIVVSPEGVEIQITGLARFCREHDLAKTAMVQVAKGRSKHHKGWKCRKADT